MHAGEEDHPQSYERHFFHHFHLLTTLIIHHPFTLSFHAYNHFLQILPTIVFLFFFWTDSADCLHHTDTTTHTTLLFSC